MEWFVGGRSGLDKWFAVFAFNMGFPGSVLIGY